MLTFVRRYAKIIALLIAAGFLISTFWIALPLLLG